MKSESPVIVLALYNRENAALRSLDSISAARYPGRNTRLVISIDNDDNKNKNIERLAIEYPWEHGEKEVIYHKERLGLREHFNFCGDLTRVYGSVIFLEDDLFVSPHYYDYALQALDFYREDNRVAGISLFSYHRLDKGGNPPPFMPVDDGYDNYFLQQASWGQVWTHNVWADYKKWFRKFGTDEYVMSLPEIPVVVKNWPGERSWKKFYISWMILHHKYYVFPRVALATNFDDLGTNRRTQSTEFQSPLLMQSKKFRFSPIDDSLSVYDSHFEILPRILKTFNPSLSEYDFEVNLYGDKKIADIRKEMVLSRIPGAKNILKFDRVMKPHELNIIFNLEGDRIFLAKRNDLLSINHTDAFIDDLVYYYRRNFSLGEIKELMWYKVRSRLMKKK
jgi:hypothetical protein